MSQRKQVEAIRVQTAIENQGKQTGEKFDFDLYSNPKWRPHSPEKWMDPKNDGIVPTSQSLLMKHKDLISRQIKENAME